MAEKSFTIVEKTDSDNGHHWWYSAFTWGEQEAGSVKEMVDIILKGLGKKDCIKELVIVGHGAPGNISVGNGQSGTDPEKEINGNNESSWGPQLDRLACRFCKGGTVYLRGCNVGAGKEGADKLFRIAQRLKCAIVKAPSGVCYPTHATGDDQTVHPTDPKPPTPLPDPNSKKKKKSARATGETETAEVVRFVAGEDGASLTQFETGQITAARYLPRVLGRPFAVRLVESRGIALPPELVARLARALASATLQSYPSCAFQIDGYLQFQVKESELNWLAPGAVMGGGVYYSPLRGDTSVVYILGDDLTAEFRELKGKAGAAPATIKKAQGARKK